MHGTPDLFTARASIRAQQPAVPAPGPLEHVAGLLVARAAPLDPTRQQELLAQLGLTSAADINTTGSRPVSSSVRLRTLARSTGVPRALEQAVQICATHPTGHAGQALREADLVRSDDVTAVQLVERLRDLYGMATAARHALGAADRRLWQSWASRARRRGAVVLPDDLLTTAATVRPWLSKIGLASDGACLIRRDDLDSRLSLLVHRQLAVTDRSPLQQLADGVRRAQPDLHQPGTDLADLIRLLGPIPTDTARRRRHSGRRARRGDGYGRPSLVDQDGPRRDSGLQRSRRSVRRPLASTDGRRPDTGRRPSRGVAIADPAADLPTRLPRPGRDDRRPCIIEGGWVVARHDRAPFGHLGRRLGGAALAIGLGRLGAVLEVGQDLVPKRRRSCAARDPLLGRAQLRRG